MVIQQLTLGSYQTNCYFLFENKQVIIIDPGSAAAKIIAYLDQFPDIKVLAILLTHGHLDHVGAVDKLYEKYHCDVYCSEDEVEFITNEIYEKQMEYHVTLKCPVKVISSNQLEIGDFKFNVIASPGHTKGSVMYQIDKYLFSGDTLFYHSVGRTDLYGGNRNQLSQSLQVVYQLNQNTIVYPGHEQQTTIGEEIQNNPYL